MLARAVVITGALRGEPLIKKYTPRLKGIIGFEPFPGTLDLKIDRKIDFRPYVTEALEHILLSGHKYVEAYLAPARLHIKGESYDCWAFWFVGNERPERRDNIEIIAKDSLRQKFSLKDGDAVELELFEPVPKKGKKDLFGFFRGGGETRLSR